MTSAPDPRTLSAIDRVGPALAAALEEPAWNDAQVALISGGKSNLTFEISCAAGELVLRRPPTGAILPRAHDMGREARIQRALAPTPVPVPQIVLDDDGGLAGFPFYVMRKVDGRIIRTMLPPGYADGSRERTAIADALVDTLCRLHAVDPGDVGLSDFGRPDGFAERQVRLWTSQWQRTRTHEVDAMERLGALLAQRIPRQQRATVVHGDFRLDNTVMNRDDPGRVAAVLDWELSTIGDPLTDVALLLLYWRQEGDHPIDLIPSLTAQPGFPDRDHLLERYANASQLDLTDMAFYQALAHFKFAAILQGIAARVTAGAMAGQDFGGLDETIGQTAEAGLDLLTG